MTRTIAAAGLLASAGLASGEPLLETFFHDDFEQGLDRSVWVADSRVMTAPSLGGTFIGQMGTSERAVLRLTLPDLPPIDEGDPFPDIDLGDLDGHIDPDLLDDDRVEHRGQGAERPGYVLQFDLYVIDSWDGFEPTHGLDRFRVLLNQGTQFEEYFTNHGTPDVLGPQTYEPRENDIVRTNFGFERWNDSLYRDVTVVFDASDLDTQDAEITFQALGLQVINDESWALDNVRLSTTDDIDAYIPAPGTALPLAGAGLLLGRRRR